MKCLHFSLIFRFRQRVPKVCVHKMRITTPRNSLCRHNRIRGAGSAIILIEASVPQKCPKCPIRWQDLVARIRFYLHKEFRAAEIGFYLHKEFRAAGIRFYLHKEFLKKNHAKTMIYLKTFPRCARQFVYNFLREVNDMRSKCKPIKRK